MELIRHHASVKMLPFKKSHCGTWEGNQRFKHMETWSCCRCCQARPIDSKFCCDIDGKGYVIAHLCSGGILSVYHVEYFLYIKGVTQKPGSDGPSHATAADNWQKCRGRYPTAISCGLTAKTQGSSPQSECNFSVCSPIFAFTTLVYVSREQIILLLYALPHICNDDFNVFFS